MQMELKRWGEHGASFICSETAEKAGDFAYNLMCVTRPYLDGCPIRQNWPSPVQVVMHAQYCDGGILPALFYALISEILTLGDMANINKIAEAARKVFALFEEVLRKIGYSARRVASLVGRLRFRVKDIVSNDYFVAHKYFKYSEKRGNPIEVPDGYRLKILMKAANLVHEFMDEFIKALNILQQNHVVDEFRPIEISEAAKWTVLYCERKEGLVLLKVDENVMPVALKISPRASVVWNVMRKICTSRNGEAKLSKAEINAFRRTDSDNNKVSGDLEILSQHLVSADRPNYYKFSAKAREVRCGGAASRLDQTVESMVPPECAVCQPLAAASSLAHSGPSTSPLARPSLRTPSA